MRRNTTTVRSIAVLTAALTGLFAALFARSVTPRAPRRRAPRPTLRGSQR